MRCCAGPARSAGCCRLRGAESRRCGGALRQQRRRLCAKDTVEGKRRCVVGGNCTLTWSGERRQRGAGEIVTVGACSRTKVTIGGRTYAIVWQGTACGACMRTKGAVGGRRNDIVCGGSVRGATVRGGCSSVCSEPGRCGDRAREAVGASFRKAFSLPCCHPGTTRSNQRWSAGGSCCRLCRHLNFAIHLPADPVVGYRPWACLCSTSAAA